MRTNILRIIAIIAMMPFVCSAMTNPRAYTTNYRNQNLIGRQLTRFDRIERQHDGKPTQQQSNYSN